MSFGELGFNAMQIVFILFIFWALILRLNRIEKSIDSLKEKDK